MRLEYIVILTQIICLIPNVIIKSIVLSIAILVFIRVENEPHVDDVDDADDVDDDADDVLSFTKEVENEFKDYMQPWTNFNNLTPMTDALSDFMGMPRGSLAARKDISDAVLAYVRDNGMDAHISALMDTTVTLPFNKFTLVLFIKSHFNVKEKEKEKKKPSHDLQLSAALCDFLECPHGTRMSRSQLIHCIEHYIRIEQIDLETDIDFVGPIECVPGVPKFVTLMCKICEQHILP